MRKNKGPMIDPCETPVVTGVPLIYDHIAISLICNYIIIYLDINLLHNILVSIKSQSSIGNEMLKTDQCTYLMGCCYYPCLR